MKEPVRRPDRPSAPDPDTPDNAERLRDQIDHGGTGDKVSYPDPAAAPLGTDDEAAGTPLTSEQVRRAEAVETARAAPQPPRRTDPLRPTRPGWMLWAVLAAVLVIAALLFVGMD